MAQEVTDPSTDHQLKNTIVAEAQMNNQGRVVIPAEIRREMGIEGQTNLVFSYADGRLTVRTMEDAVAFVQRLAAQYVPDRGSAVDDFIADRRRAAAQE